MNAGRAQQERGFTLIELLVAVAILALVSIMAVNLLSAGLFQREVLTRHDREARVLARALALLRQDLESAAPIPLENGTVFVVREAEGFAFMRGGIHQVPGLSDAAFLPVRWQVTAQGTLTRTLGSDSDGAGESVLDGVSEIRLMPFGPDTGSADATGALSQMPAGFELTLTQLQHGALRLVVLR